MIRDNLLQAAIGAAFCGFVLPLMFLRIKRGKPPQGIRGSFRMRSTSSCEA
jgi:hypothetical protein